jgi:hypothetical protein
MIYDGVLQIKDLRYPFDVRVIGADLENFSNDMNRELGLQTKLLGHIEDSHDVMALSHCIDVSVCVVGLCVVCLFL